MTARPECHSFVSLLVPRSDRHPALYRRDIVGHTIAAAIERIGRIFPLAGAGAGAPADRAGDGPDAGMRREVLQEHRPPFAVGERDPPVRVLAGRPGHVLRLS